jgi:hypothetical protein
MRYQPNYHIACRIQDRILNAMGVQTQLKHHVKPELAARDLTPTQLAALASAWDKLEDRKRIIRMKPLPKAQDVTPQKRERKAATFQE